jgi:hypothetical protein
MKHGRKFVLGAVVVAALLSLQVEVKRDLEGNITLAGLTSEKAMAEMTEGKAMAVGCYMAGQATAVSVRTQCNGENTTSCNPTSCPAGTN